MTAPAPLVIAIDGTAASGKSTVARRVARHLGLRFFSTGETYRAATWLAMDEGLPPDDAKRLVEAMQRRQLDIIWSDGQAVVTLGGQPLDKELRTAAVNAAVSVVSSLSEVRQYLVALQRRVAADAGIVLEGRDIGTVVCPETPYKFYIDASPEVRQRRREAEGQRDQVVDRDRADIGRVNSPLKIAPGALHIDTSSLDIDEVVRRVLAHVQSEPAVTGGGHP